MANMKEQVGNMNTRKKVIAAVFAVIVVIILWQAYTMFGGSFGAAPVEAPPPAAPPAPKMTEVTAQPVQQSPEQQQLAQMETQMQVKYIAALNELQMLKVAQQLVETNQKIMKSKEDTVSSQKKIVDMLVTPDAPPPPPPSQSDQDQAQAQKATRLTYSVVSVSQVQGKWGAVLSAGSTLYSIHTGDSLADGSTIISIDKNGVMLEKDGSRSKLPMISSI